MAPIAEEKLQKGDRGGARRKILRLGLATFGGTVLRQCDFKRLALRGESAEITAAKATATSVAALLARKLRTAVRLLA